MLGMHKTAAILTKALKKRAEDALAPVKPDVPPVSKVVDTTPQKLPDLKPTDNLKPVEGSFPKGSLHPGAMPQAKQHANPSVPARAVSLPETVRTSNFNVVV